MERACAGIPLLSMSRFPPQKSKGHARDFGTHKEDVPRVSLQEYQFTAFSSEMRTKLRDWAVGQARASCYSQAALSSNDSKTLYGNLVQCSLVLAPYVLM